jgi:MFS family permease
LNFIRRNFDRLNIYSGLPRSVYVLATARVVNAMGNFVYPFLTLFLTEHLGFSTVKAGTYFTISAAAQVLGSVLGGKLTDKFGRKKLYLTFQGFTALCYLPCAFLGDSIIIAWLLIIAGFLSNAAQPANSAMVTDLTNKNNRKQAYSLLYLGINLGFSIGPVIAAFLYKNYTWLIFLGNTIAILFTLILLFFGIEDTTPSEKEIENSKTRHDSESAEDGNVIKALLKRPYLLLFLIGTMVNSFIYSSIRFVLPLQLSQVFGRDLGPKYFGYMMSTNGIVIILVTTFIIKITIKIKPIMNVSFASLFFAVGLGLLGFVKSFPVYILAAVLYTLGEILEATNTGVYIANHSPINHRGRFNAAGPLIMGIGSSIAPSVFGKLMTDYGNTTLWIVCFVMGIGTSIFLAWVGRFETKYINTVK